MKRGIASSRKDIEEIAVLLLEGFQEEFQALNLPEVERSFVLRCLAEHILQNHRDNLLIVRDKKIEGILFIKPKKWKGLKLLGRLFIQLNLQAFFKTCIFLVAFDHRSKAKEIHIDFIAVTKCNRGKGIGTQLIKLVKNLVKGDQYVTLYVSATNAAASRLYERLGFQIKKKGTSLIGRQYGIERWYFMEWKGIKNNENEV